MATSLSNNIGENSAIGTTGKAAVHCKKCGGQCDASHSPKKKELRAIFQKRHGSFFDRVQAY